MKKFYQYKSFVSNQVNVSILDVNDNSPEFDASMVKISVPENAILNEAIYATHARDLDSTTNGLVIYELVQNPHKMFTIDRVRMNPTGKLILKLILFSSFSSFCSKGFWCSERNWITKLLKDIH